LHFSNDRRGYGDFGTLSPFVMEYSTGWTFGPAGGSPRGWSKCEASVVGFENPTGWTFGRGRSRILLWFAGWK